MVTLKWEHVLPISLDEAWIFFSDPHNLSKITPESMDFKIISDTPHELYEGMVINYTLRPLFGIKMPWSTEITHVKDKEYFIDNQLSGPYKIWHHEHHFNKTENGILMTDILNYELSYFILNPIIDNLVVRNQVKRIFSFRKKCLNELFK